MDHRSTPLLPCLAVALVIAVLPARLQAQRTSFTILKGGHVVGTILAARTATGSQSSYVITSYAEFDLVWKQVVRTAMGVEYVDGALASCHSMVRVNNGLRDSSHMATRNGTALCYVHPRPPFPYTGGSQWTTARMYFEEPVDQPSVFVESVLKDCPLHRTGEGLYTLTLPDRSVNRYIYRNGVLQEIHVDRALVDLVFRRS